VTTTAVPPRNAGDPAPARSGGARSFWNRQLPHYPDNGPRAVYLAITVLATIVLYYELYIPGAVATNIIADLHLSFTFFVMVSVVGNLVGAFASLFAGLADRWGRANLVVGGLLITALIIGLGLPNAGSKATYITLFAVLSFVEGIVLVATPALIRDFSPQVGRGAAMGFWTLGPVLGSLAVTEISSHTLNATGSNWKFEFQLCGIIGGIVFLVALIGLRELSPAIRDQLMVSMRDRALIEARAKGLDTEKALKGHWRQMMRFDIIGSAFAISIFLLLYYMLVGFAVVYFQTVFEYTAAEANSLANWYWIANAISLVVVGILTDRFRVRKPFMVIGTVIGLVGSILFAISATHPDTGYHTIGVYFILSAAGGGMAYVAWMTSFTETVERHNPAATATGLAIWGWILRLVVTVSLAVFTLVMPAVTTLVDKGPHTAELAGKYKTELATLAKIDPATQKALAANSGDQLAQAKAVSDISGVPVTDVAKASQLSTQYAQQLETAGAIDQATLASLATNPTDTATATKAVGEIAQKLGLDRATALRRLQALGAVPKGDLVFLQTTGPKVQAGADQLIAAGKIPAADLQYLQANGAKVTQAQEDNPHQWQRWWWVCIAGQVLFLPFVFVMAGRWSPRKAREDERAHEEMVQRELAALQGGRA
jgi:MFS transporter, ACS family, D-galactonate transporter